MIVTIFNLIAIIVFLHIIYNYKMKRDSVIGTNSKQKSKKSKQKAIVVESETIVSIIPTKNKFLFPEDGLGKLEQNVVYDSLTYDSKIKNNPSDQFDLIILSSNQEIQS
jgi:hypothetical protein